MHFMQSLKNHFTNLIHSQKVTNDVTYFIKPELRPFFVYGTLRPGCGNYEWCLQEHSRHEQEGFLADASMYSNGGFPYVLEDGGEGIVGTLIYVKPEDWETVVTKMDQLEGTRYGLEDDRNHYNRYKRLIEVGENQYVEAWIYMPPTTDYKHIQMHNTHLKHGDWLKRAQHPNLYNHIFN